MIKIRAVSLLFGAVVLSQILSLNCQAQQTPSRSIAELAQRDAWRKSMKQVTLPTSGCFKASYPNEHWQEVACTSAPNVPYPPAKGVKPLTVGNGTDFAARATSGLLSSAEGSFPTVTGLTSATNYSLQANSNYFPDPPACSGAANPSTCEGWEQFIYSETSSTVFMEYWLLNYAATCPAGWTSESPHCFKNSSATAVPTQPIGNLPYLTLTGKATGGTDTATLENTLNDDLYTVTAADTVVDLENHWTDAEFNVLGDCCSSEVNFNSGSSFVVKVNINNGTTNPAACPSEGLTGETNNLTLSPQGGPVCCPYGGTSPSIQFLESNVSGATASCGASSLNTNLAATPTSIDGKATVITHPVIQGEIRTQYSAILEDTTPGATIHYQFLDSCGDSLGSGSVSPGTTISYLDTEINGQTCTYSFRATMYATAPGYLQTPTTNVVF